MMKMTCNEANFQIMEGNAKGSNEGSSCKIEQEFGSVTYGNCDCSDPDNYSFYDEGRF